MKVPVTLSSNYSSSEKKYKKSDSVKLRKLVKKIMLMSPDSSSSEVDPRPPMVMPNQMIQVPECTQSTHGLIHKAQQQHIIHVDYGVKKVSELSPTKSAPPSVPQIIKQQPPIMQQQKSDEDLNLGKSHSHNFSRSLSRRPLTLKKIFLIQTGAGVRESI